MHQKLEPEQTLRTNAVDRTRTSEGHHPAEERSQLRKALGATGELNAHRKRRPRGPTYPPLNLSAQQVPAALADVLDWAKRQR